MHFYYFALSLCVDVPLNYSLTHPLPSPEKKTFSADSSVRVAILSRRDFSVAVDDDNDDGKTRRRTEKERERERERERETNTQRLLLISRWFG